MFLDVRGELGITVVNQDFLKDFELKVQKKTMWSVPT